MSLYSLLAFIGARSVDVPARMFWQRHHNRTPACDAPTPAWVHHLRQRKAEQKRAARRRRNVRHALLMNARCQCDACKGLAPWW